MKKIFFILSLLILVNKGYAHNPSDTTGLKNAITQLKTEIIGTWYPEGHGATTHKQGAIFDTTLYNSLPFKTNDKIVFEKNGFFRVNDAKAKKRYEILNDASSIGTSEGKFWTFHIRLDGVDYFLHFQKGYLSLGYDYGTGSWSQPLRKKEKQ